MEDNWDAEVSSMMHKLKDWNLDSWDDDIPETETENPLATRASWRAAIGSSAFKVVVLRGVTVAMSAGQELMFR